jgi:large subunit ribosomal protein L22
MSGFAVFATLRHLKMSPRKVRLVLNLVRGKGVTDALALLKFTPNAAAKPVLKLVASAAANAEENFGLERKDLFIAEIMADPGPTQKRGYFGGRSRFKPILKRSCHVSIALRERNPEPLLGAGEAADGATKSAKAGPDDKPGKAAKAEAGESSKKSAAGAKTKGDKPSGGSGARSAAQGQAKASAASKRGNVKKG